MAAQHEARADQMAALTRACINALDARGDPRDLFDTRHYDQPTPIHDDLRYYLVAKEAFEAALLQPLVVLDPDPGLGFGDDEHPLAAFLPVLGWLFFAGCVCLLVWAVQS